MRSVYEVIRRPIVTEKTTDQKDALNVIAFEVDGRATKTEIKVAVEKLFRVKVDNVRTLTVAGKLVRRGRSQGKQPNWKKAFVTLTEGSAIEFFENR